jgi:hypothetical protein
MGGVRSSTTRAGGCRAPGAQAGGGVPRWRPGFTPRNAVRVGFSRPSVHARPDAVAVAARALMVGVHAGPDAVAAR